MLNFISRFLVLFVFFALNNPPAWAAMRLRLSTTTSTENSGLLDVLLPPFEKAYNIKVDVIAVGTGKALKLGENGDVDVVFVHAREAEDKFLADGHGVDRRDVMYNDFVIVGPAHDPAGLRNSNNAAGVFKKLGNANVDFISRDDDSGTHKMERKLWKAAGITPVGKWYIEVGQGMGAVLRIADEKMGYALTDRGTYIAYLDKIKLVVVYDEDKDLLNPYGVIVVNPAKHSHIRYRSAEKFIDYLTGTQGQRIIADYTRKGQQLFFPNAVSASAAK